MLLDRRTIFTLAALSLAVLAAHPASAQTVITNGSFEANTFTNSPGYAGTGGNSAIDNWTSNNTDSGLNPFNGPGPYGSSPFADNGAIPDGKQVAFLQVDGTGLTSLTQSVSGFVAGDQYQVSFFDNARTYLDTPVLGLTLGGQTIYAPQAITSVGGTNAYHSAVSTLYTATSNGPESLQFFSTSLNGGDSTSLIDGVKITDLGPASAAPEPSQLGMLALAALGLGALAVKARKRTAAPQAA